MARKPKFGRIYQRTWKTPEGVKTLPKWWIEYYHNGRQFRESSKSTKSSVAEKLLKQRTAQAVAGILPASSTRRTKVNQLLDLLLEDYRNNGKSSEWAGYVVGHLRPRLGHLSATGITTEVLSRYVNDRRANGISLSTVNRELAILRRAFRLGTSAQPPMVQTVPTFPRFAENNVRKGFFTDAEFVRLRSQLPEHLRPVMTFAYSTGCRKGEILNLRWSQVDFANRIVRLEPGETKNGDGRTIPLIRELVDVLAAERARQRQEHPGCLYVFSRFGKRIKSFLRAWREASRRAGLVDESGKPTKLFHDLRRTGVRNLIRAGTPERVAMAISGHKTRSVLDRYNIVDESDLHSAGEKLEKHLAELRKDKAKSRVSDGSEGA